jgi:hypothetical protein
MCHSEDEQSCVAELPAIHNQLAYAGNEQVVRSQIETVVREARIDTLIQQLIDDTTSLRLDKTSDVKRVASTMRWRLDDLRRLIDQGRDE